jgi:hypothetical protein
MVLLANRAFCGVLRGPALPFSGPPCGSGERIRGEYLGVGQETEQGTCLDIFTQRVTGPVMCKIFIRVFPEKLLKNFMEIVPGKFRLLKDPAIAGSWIFSRKKIPKKLLVERFPQRDRLPEELLEFRPALPADIDVVVGAEETWLEFSVRSHAEPVAEGTELGVVPETIRLPENKFMCCPEIQ